MSVTSSVETGSEDTFREMLRIKRSVQAAFNTEYVSVSLLITLVMSLISPSHFRASYLAAQAQAARKGVKERDSAADAARDAADPMAAMERQMEEANAGTRPTAGGAPAFVRSAASGASTQAPVPVVNPDAIDIDGDDDDDE